MSLLAINATTRDAGWAFFLPNFRVETGIIAFSGSRSLDATDRVVHLLQCLDWLVAWRRPSAVAYGQPWGIHHPAPALELLDTAIVQWAAGHGLTLCTYSTKEVRDAIATDAGVQPDQLSYAIMRRLRLIGVRKTTLEWEAMAVGCYHMGRATLGDGTREKGGNCAPVSL